MGEVIPAVPALPITLRRWSADLSIGFVADVLLFGQKHDDVRRPTYRRALENLLAATLRGDSEAFRSVPLGTLRSLSADQIAEEVPNAEQIPQHAAAAIRWLMESQKGFTIPPLSAARVFSHLCLDRAVGSTAIVRAGSLLFPGAWPTDRTNRAWREEADKHLAAFRGLGEARGLGTIARLGRLNDFSRALPGADKRQHWALVENAIFRQMFAWPLVVDTSEDPTFEAVAMPVGIDVYFDGRNDVDADFGGSADAALRVSWDSELRAAVDAAKILWASKHGRATEHIKDEVRNASVVFDFRVADMLLQQTPAGLHAREGSMVPYFAQFVLHKLLGRTQAFTSVITGELGPRSAHGRTGRDVLDYEFEPAGFMERKLRYVFRSQEFSKVVVSSRQSDEDRSSAYEYAVRDNSLTEVNYCRRLSNVADAVQPGRWRREDYLRCPDLLRVLHEDTEELLPSTSPEVLEIGRLLSANTGTVIDLPEHVSAHALASYLHYANWDGREALGANGEGKNGQSTRRTPPALSWTFVRCVEDVNDRRLWRLVWDSMGAAEDDFQRFQHANNRDAAASLLGAALNTFSPSQSTLNHRAPDLLIFLDVGNVAASDHKSDAASYRTHVFSPMVDALRPKLLPTPIEDMRQLIGHTRIITIRDGGPEVSGARRASTRSDGSYAEILVLLTTFRFGFSGKMAAAFLRRLGYLDLNVRWLLSELVTQGDLTAVGGMFWVSGDLGHCRLKDIDTTECAKRHLACALAYLPHLSGKFSPTLEAPDAFCVEHVQEADHHLEIAGALASNLIQRAATRKRNPDPEAQTLRAQARTAHALLLQLLEVPGPGVVLDLTRDRQGSPARAVWTLAQDTLEEKDRLVAAGMPDAECSPIELAAYAQAGATLLAASQRESHVSPHRDVIRNDVLRLFDTAIERAATWNIPDNLLLILLSRYGCFLVAHGDRELEHRYDLRWVQERTSALLRAGVQSAGVQAKWLEIEGDRHEDDNRAAFYYRTANEMAPRYWPCIIKLLGVESTMATAERAVRIIAMEKRLPRVVEWARAQRYPIRSGLDHPWVRLRWERGSATLAQYVRGLLPHEGKATTG